MTNPTSNYSFVLPSATDLVTDLPADFDVALQGVDTRLKALQPGTTLGDIAYSSATANTNTRLGIGSAAQVLTVAGGVPTWATPAGSAVAKNYTLVNTGGTTLTGTSVSITGLSSYDDLIVIIRGGSSSSASQSFYMSVNSVTSANSYTRAGMLTSFAATYNNAISSTTNASDTEIRLGAMSNDQDSTISGGISIAGCRGTGIKPLDAVFSSSVGSGTANAGAIVYKGVINASTAISSVQIFLAGAATFDAGTLFVYGAA